MCAMEHSAASTWLHSLTLREKKNLQYVDIGNFPLKYSMFVGFIEKNVKLNEISNFMILRVIHKCQCFRAQEFHTGNSQ